MSGSTLRFDSSFPITISTDIVSDQRMFGGGGEGGIYKAGVGNLTLSGNNSYTGKTYLYDGRLTVAKDESLGARGGPSARTTSLEFHGGTLAIEGSFSSVRPVNLDKDGTFDVDRDRILTMEGLFSGSGKLFKDGLGSFILDSADNSYTGSEIDIRRGSFEVWVKTTSSNIENSGKLIFKKDSDNSMDGTISGTGTLHKEGTGTLTLSKENSYTGNTVITAGTLKVSTDSALGDEKSNLNFKGGTLLLADNFGASQRDVNIDAPMGAINVPAAKSVTLGGSFNGGGTFKKEGLGALILTRPVDYTGDVEVNAGSLKMRAGRLTGNFKIDAPLIFDQEERDIGEVSGVISGAASFQKKGSGTLILSGENTYTSDTELLGGTLQIAKESNLGDYLRSRLVVEEKAKLSVTESFKSERRVRLLAELIISVEENKNFEIAEGKISGEGSLNKKGPGTLTLNRSSLRGFSSRGRYRYNTYSRGTTVSEGTLEVNLLQEGPLRQLGLGSLILDGGKLLTKSKVIFDRKTLNINAPSTIEVSSNSASFTTNVRVIGGGDLNKEGFGLLALNGDNSGYTGNMNLLKGVLKVTQSLGSDDSFVNFKGGTLSLGGSFSSGKKMHFEKDGIIEVPGVFEAVLSGTLGLERDPGRLIKKGTGTLELTGDNKYEKGTTIMEGTLRVDGDSALGNSKGNLVFDHGGTLELPSDFTSNERKVVFDGLGVIKVERGTATFAGFFGGRGALTKTGVGKLSLTNPGSYIDGVTTINGGILELNAHVIQSNIDIANSAFLIFNQSATGTYGGRISGAGSVSKKGAKDLVLSARNFYTGTTTIEQGRLVLEDYGTLGDSHLDVKKDATLLIATNAKTIPVKSLSGLGTIHIHDGNTLQVESGSFSGTISSSPASLDLAKGFGLEGGGNLSKVSSAVLRLSGTNTYTGKTTIKKGTLQLATGLNRLSDLEVLKGGVCELQLGELQVRQINGAGKIKLGNHRLKVDGGSFAGNIEGSAGSRLEQVGKGTLTLSGTNTFEHLSFQGTLKFFSDDNLGDSGTLELNGGTLSPSKTMRLSKDLHVSAESVIDVGHAFSDRFRLTLLGSLTGGKEGDTKFDLKKEGLGKVEIGHATNPFEGNLIVDKGTLVIPKGKKLTKATVRLTGGASVLIGASEAQASEESLASLEHNYGTVRIGQEGSSETGIFKVGTYKLGSSGNLHIRLKPTFGTADPLEPEADLLEAETANLDDNGGSLFLDLASGFYEPGATYTILKAKILNGEHLEKIKILEKHPLHFELIKQPLAEFQALQIKVLFSEAVLPVDLDQLKGDAREIAENLFSSPTSPSKELKHILKPIIESTPEEFIKDLLILGPQKFGRGITLLNAQSNINVAREMNRSQAFDGRDTLGSQSQDPNQSVWVTPIAFTTKQKEIESLYSFSSKGYGFVAGYSHLLKSLVLSIGTGYTDSKLNWYGDKGDAHIQAAYIAPSVGYHGKHGDFGLVLSCARRFYETNRKMRFEGRSVVVKEKAYNEHKGYDMLAGLVGAFRIKCSNSVQEGLFIIPTVRFDYVNMIEFGYQERGAGPINLFVQRMQTSFFRSEFNFKFLKKISLGSLRVCPSLFVGWLVDVPLKKGEYTAGFQEELSKKDFVVQGYHESTDQINLGAELLIMRPGSCSLKFSYRANLGGSFWTQEGLLNLNVEF